MERKCEQCAYWVQVESWRGTGDCRRFPPIVVSSIGSTTIHDNRQGYMRVPTSYSETGHPQTKADHWCGEFELNASHPEQLER